MEFLIADEPLEQDFDRRLMSRAMDALGDDVTYAVLPDHPVPLRLGTHTRTPVPVSICAPGLEADGVQVYDEDSSLNGDLGQMKADEFMCRLLGPVGG